MVNSQQTCIYGWQCHDAECGWLAVQRCAYSVLRSETRTHQSTRSLLVVLVPVLIISVYLSSPIVAIDIVFRIWWKFMTSCECHTCDNCVLSFYRWINIYLSVCLSVRLSDYLPVSLLLCVTLGYLAWLKMRTQGSIMYHVRPKTALFYFCNSFVKTSLITTIFGTHILQQISYHPRIQYSLYNQRREPAEVLKVQQASTPCTHNHRSALLRDARLPL